MLILCLILFGLLQLFLISAARMVTDFSAFRTARSGSVGFTETLCAVEGLIRSIPAAGVVKSTLPDMYADQSKDEDRLTSEGNILSRLEKEKLAIEDYVSGERNLRYEYWTEDDNDYGTAIGLGLSVQGNRLTGYTGFFDYPLRMPFASAFLPDGKLDIRSSVPLINHAAVFLEE